MSDNPDNSGGSPVAAENNQASERKSGGSLGSLVRVIIILIIGATVGVVSFLLIAPHIIFIGGHSPFSFPPFISSRALGALTSLIAEHIIFSTVGIALLASLLVAYARTYKQTKANFALGIFIVLLALLFEGILDYPILQLSLGPVSASEFSSPLPTIADIFTVIAYAVFLYLSLE